MGNIGDPVESVSKNNSRLACGDYIRMLATSGVASATLQFTPKFQQDDVTSNKRGEIQVMDLSVHTSIHVLSSLV